MITVNINGRDTLFVSGTRALMDETQLQREYLVACTLRVGEHIYLVHARYNPASDRSRYRRVM